MSNSRIWVFGVVAISAAVVGALGAFWFGSQSFVQPAGVEVTSGAVGDGALQARLDKQRNDALQSDLAKQHEVITRLSARLAQMERELRSAPTRAVDGSPDQRGPIDEAGLVGDTPAPMTPDQAVDTIRAFEEESLRRDRERVTAIDGRWASEPIDHEWATRYEDDVREALDSLGSNSVTLTDINCRASMCKLALNNGDPAVDAGDLDALNTHLIDLEPFENTEFTITKPEGGDPGQIVVYLSRPGGNGLPQLATSR